MEKILRAFIQWCAQKFRGSTYYLDSELPITTLVSVALQRSLGLLRCVIRGIAWKPSDLLFVGRGVVLRSPRLIRLGRGVTLGDNVYINGLSREGVEIGQGTTIGSHSIIEATGVISNLGKGCQIGANSGIGAFSFIGAAGGVRIGENVIMGQYISFHSENHCFEKLDVPIRMQGVTRVGICIDDDCWIGAKVTFLDGCHVGKGSIIAAGSVVRGFIPPYSVAAGVPARIIKSRMDVSDG